MTVFPAQVVDAVLHHMNTDHLEDNLLIVRAFGGEQAVEARMTGLDEHAGLWSWADAAGGQHELTIPWPSGTISERAEIRREVVVLYRTACDRLGVEAREH